MREARWLVIRMTLPVVMFASFGAGQFAGAAEPAKADTSKALFPITPDWVEASTSYELPEWYDAIRVCAHTRLGPPMKDKPIFLDAGAKIRSLGFLEFSRHIKSGREGAWWPSKVGAVEEWAKDRNVAKLIIDDCHKAGLRLIAYHRHMEDAAIAEEHPDWVCVDWSGRQMSTNRGNYMCFNSSYRDYFLQRALELVDLGVDGFYYDETHMPKTGCWCKFCKDKFKATTGLDHPAKADPNDPVWQRLIDFNNDTIEQTFLYWRKAIHERNPQVVMLIGSHTYPLMTERHLTQRLFRIADSVKTEFSLPIRGEFAPNAKGEDFFSKPGAGMRTPETDARLALGYDLSRDSADGRPAHIWTHGLLNERSAVFSMAGVVAHGCASNLDNKEDKIPNPALFKKAVEIGNRAATGLAGTRPLHWALIHFAESARDKFLKADAPIAPRAGSAKAGKGPAPKAAKGKQGAGGRAFSRNDQSTDYYPDLTVLWRENLYPFFAAYKTLLRAHLPVAIITDSQLEQGLLDGCRVLFEPAPDQLTGRMRAAIEKFKAAGGIVVEQKPEWKWADPKGHDAAAAAFMQTIAGEVAKAPVQVFGGPEKMQSVVFTGKKDKRVTVAMANDFSWVFTGKHTLNDGTPRNLKPFEDMPAPPPCQGVKVVLRGQGQPKKVTDAASGAVLTPKASGDTLEIAVPDFEALSVVVAEF